VALNADGTIVRTVYNPFAVVSILGLTLLSFIGAGLGAIEISSRLAPARRTASPDQGERVAAASAKLEQELTAILGLIKTYLETNDRFSSALAGVQKQLPSMTKPDQVRLAVQLLIAESEKVQRDASQLRSNLELSKSQIDDLRSNLDEANEMGLRDPLTGVGNRRCFDHALKREVSQATEQRSPMCLVMGDIDHFKRVNDEFGHVVGDEVLKMFARLLLENVKGRDTVARYGGEEFAIVLPETRLDTAIALANRIRTQLETKNLVVKGAQKLGKMTASFGVAELRDGDEPELLLQRADAKLYEAKYDGRNRVAAYGRTSK
jgi:diguanylate cyclase